MTRRLIDMPVERIAVEHYLFDLEYPPEKVSEIFGMDEEDVRKVHDDYVKFILPTRRIK